MDKRRVKMKDNFSEIVVILDRSGSMGTITLDTIGGFNTFIKSQKDLNLGECNVTLVQFDDKYELHYAGKKLSDVPDLTLETYVPRGGTSLLDAIGKTITEVGSRLASTPEAIRPSKVIFVIITDGAENTSKEYKTEQIKTMVEHQTNKYAWDFLYLNCDLAGFDQAANMGFGADKALLYNKMKTGTAYDTFTSNVARSRSGLCSSFTAEQVFANK